MNQTTTAEQSTAPVLEPPAVTDEATDAELIAAAQEAGGTASIDVVAAAAAAGTPPPAGTEPAGAEVTEPKIAAVLRAREEAHQKRLDAEDYAAQRRQAAEREAEQIVAEARRKAAADYEADLQQRRAQFQATPAARLRELGTPEEIHDAVMREGTPEGRAHNALLAQVKAAEEKAKVAEAVKADFEAFKQQAAKRETEAQLREVEHRFMTTHATPEATPYLHKRYEPEEILAKAHAKAAEWTRAGVPFAHSDVAEYLEHQARQRLAGVPVPSQQVSGGGSAQKVRAAGSRTLSAATGSERRASPKPLEDMSPEEERNALMDAAAEARRAIGS